MLASAIEDHIPTSTKFNSQSPMTFNQADYANCDGAPQWSGPWTVHNETGTGIYDMYTGTQKSINTYFTQLEQLTGICQPFALARQMGVDLTNPNGTGAGSSARSAPPPSPSHRRRQPTGDGGRVRNLAARGKFCEPQPVAEIDDSAGTVLKKYTPSCKQVMPDWVADQVNDITRGVQEPGGFGYELGQTNLSTADGRVIPSGGKTGTTNGDASVWFDAYTPQISTVAMIAGANSSGHPDTLDNKTVGGHFTGYEASGSGFAGPMWPMRCIRSKTRLTRSTSIRSTPQPRSGPRATSRVSAAERHQGEERPRGGGLPRDDALRSTPATPRAPWPTARRRELRPPAP